MDGNDVLFLEVRYNSTLTICATVQILELSNYQENIKKRKKERSSNW